MFGLRARILWIAGLTMAATILAITLIAGKTFSEAYSKAIAERSEAISHEVGVQFERLLSLGLQPEEIVGFEDQCSKVKQNHHDLAFVAVLSPQGGILFHSTPQLIGQQIAHAGLAAAASLDKTSKIAASVGGRAGAGDLDAGVQSRKAACGQRAGRPQPGGHRSTAVAPVPEHHGGGFPLSRSRGLPALLGHVPLRHRPPARCGDGRLTPWGLRRRAHTSRSRSRPKPNSAC
jgi:hypothetical protein